jgi:hypothetical protein
MICSNFINIYKELELDLNELKQSPIFAMSLGAKELFHTNFLAYILETDNNDFKKSQKSLIKLLTGKDKGVVSVSREESHLDLIIRHDDISVYIEAKLKSLPLKNQLDSYNQTISQLTKKQSVKNLRKLIISPIDPDLQDGEWEWLGWDKIENCIQVDESLILKIYKNDLRLINKICTAVFNGLNLEVHPWSFISKISIEFIPMRIHDVVGKLMTDKVRRFFEEKLKESHPEIFGKIDILTEYTKQQPMITIKTKDKIIGTDYKIGIQIQGRDERYFIESDKNESVQILYEGENKNNKLIADLWIFNGKLKVEKGSKECELASNPNWENIYKFGLNFRYGKKSDPSQTILSCLVNEVINSFLKLFQSIPLETEVKAVAIQRA